MRLVTWLAGLLATGCVSGARPWILVVDDAQLDAVTACDGGDAPDAYAIARLGRSAPRTGVVSRTFTPVWHDPMLEADEGSYRNGVQLEVWTRCGNLDAPAGVVRVRLARSTVRGGGVALARFGAVDALRFHFQAPDAQAGWSDYGAPAGGYDWVGYSDDGSGTWDDGSDDGWDDGSGDGWDDGSGDGTWDDGSGDGTWDDGSGDTGDTGGDSGDSGGDSGDDSGGGDDGGGGGGGGPARQRVRRAPTNGQLPRPAPSVAQPPRAARLSQPAAAPPATVSQIARPR